MNIMIYGMFLKFNLFCAPCSSPSFITLTYRSYWINTLPIWARWKTHTCEPKRENISLHLILYNNMHNVVIKMCFTQLYITWSNLNYYINIYIYLSGIYVLSSQLSIGTHQVLHKLPRLHRVVNKQLNEQRRW